MSDAFRDKLRRLRRETSPESRDAAGSPASRSASDAERARDTLPIWAAKRLEARLRRAHPDAGERLLDLPTEGASRTVGPPRGLVRVANEHGSYAVRETRFSHDARHGDWRLGAIDAARHDDLVLLARDERLRALDLRRAVYLDVETTGLSGGAGTTSFLVALGAFEGDEFVLWQGFLVGPEDERAMLVEVANRVRDAVCVVSFFGKSFDRHRLEDKMRLHGVAPPFDEAPHLDLFHPLARLYKGALPNTKLQTMERALCGVARDDDLPGSFAPEAWFDFLGGRAHRLEDVFRHNADDVLSLVVLAAHLGRSLADARDDGVPLAGPRWHRARAIAQLHADARDTAEALRWIERARGEDAPSVVARRELELFVGDVLRRTGDDAAAHAAFRAAAGDVPERARGATSEPACDELALRARLEIAKLCEHRLRDLAGAVESTRAALALLDAGALPRRSARRERERRELVHRLERLTRKLTPSA